MAGREVTISKDAQVRRLYMTYPLEEQRRINGDLPLRFAGPWKNGGMSADWYLKNPLWRTEPLGQNQFVQQAAVRQHPIDQAFEKLRQKHGRGENGRG